MCPVFGHIRLKEFGQIEDAVGGVRGHFGVGGAVHVAYITDQWFDVLLAYALYGNGLLHVFENRGGYAGRVDGSADDGGEGVYEVGLWNVGQFAQGQSSVKQCDNFDGVNIPQTNRLGQPFHVQLLVRRVIQLKRVIRRNGHDDLWYGLYIWAFGRHSDETFA